MIEIIILSVLLFLTLKILKGTSDTSARPVRKASKHTTTPPPIATDITDENSDPAESSAVIDETYEEEEEEEEDEDDSLIYHQGYFEPQNPEKYRGDPENIIFRSHWELLAFQYCDTSPKIIAWASEELTIPYYMKGRYRPRNYFPDLMIYFQSKEVVMVEIKPKYEAQNPSRQNISKWAAARRYCKERDWQFQIWTEDTINKFRLPKR